MSLQDCEGCLVAGCTVKRFAGSGIFIHGGHRDGILGCDLYSLGRGATEVMGGDRKTLTPAQHFVENCLMHSLGRLDHTYVPGIGMAGVGIRVAHNRFYGKVWGSCRRSPCLSFTSDAPTRRLRFGKRTCWPPGLLCAAAGS